jgi:hypothetical protein
MSSHTAESSEDHHLSNNHHEDLKAYKDKYVPLVNYNATKTYGPVEVINPHWMIVKGQLYTLVVLPSTKEPPAGTEYQARWAPKTVRDTAEKKIFCF